MNKDVGSLIHYQEQALACNRRYLDALAVVDDPAPAYQELRQLTEPKVVAGRSFAGFNPARREDVRLFAAVLDGDHIARGFRNKDIRAALFGTAASFTPPWVAWSSVCTSPTGREDPAHPAVGALPTPAATCSVELFSSTTKPGPNCLPRNSKTSLRGAEKFRGK